VVGYPIESSRQSGLLAIWWGWGCCVWLERVHGSIPRSDQERYPLGLSSASVDKLRVAQSLLKSRIACQCQLCNFFRPSWFSRRFARCPIFADKSVGYSVL